MIGLIASALIQSAPVASVEKVAYPLPFQAPISSRFSSSRYHPILHTYRPHRGIDLAAPEGTEVRSAIAGRVVLSGWSDSYGNRVIVENDGMRTLYAHLSSLAVRANDSVGVGQKLGRVGSTGWSTGAHLHFETQIKTGDSWQAVDPLPRLASPNVSGR